MNCAFCGKPLSIKQVPFKTKECYELACTCTTSYKAAYTISLDYQVFFIPDAADKIHALFKRKHPEFTIKFIQGINSFKSNFFTMICYYNDSDEFHESITIPVAIKFSNLFELQNKALAYMIMS